MFRVGPLLFFSERVGWGEEAGYGGGVWWRGVWWMGGGGLAVTGGLIWTQYVPFFALTCLGGVSKLFRVGSLTRSPSSALLPILFWGRVPLLK